MGSTPAVTISPTSLAFGNQQVGVKSTKLKFTTTNNSSAKVTITSMVVSLADYTFTTYCPLGPKKLSPGSSCSTSVWFTPASPTTESATLTVSTDSGANPVLNLSGTGYYPVSVSPATLTFATQTVGSTSSPQNVLLTNGQTTGLTITSITSSLSDFGFSTSCPLSPTKLAAGETCSTAVTFTPSASGTRTGTLTLNDTGAGSPQTVTLSGTGTTSTILQSISVAPVSTAIAVGGSAQFTATGTYSDGSTQDITSSATWTSSNSNVANAAGGLVSGVADGIAAITASLSGVTSPVSTTSVGNAADFYVATNGNDSWSGQLTQPNARGTDGPFATVARAQTAVQSALASPNGRTTPITVMIRGGNYYQQALSFSSADSGSANLPALWQNYPNETPLLSGGMLTTGWTSIGNSAYQTTLPSSAKYFENLFYNGGRRLRPRLNGSVGSYLRVAGTVYLSGAAPPSPPPDPNCAVYVSKSGWECFDRFKFNHGDLSSSWQNLNAPYPTGDIELVDFELWTVPRMRIKSVDTVNNIAYLTGPTSQAASVHGFIANHRYLVENVKDWFTAAGQWFLDTSATPWTLSYIANPGENPLTDTIVAPQSTQVLTATGLQYVTFKGLTFAHDNFTVGSAGYVSVQQEPRLLAAVGCYNCQYVTFDSDIITQASGSGFEFKTTDTSKTTAYNTFQNGAVYDIGGMGIRVGTTPSGNDTDANVPQFTTIQNNLVEGYGRVFPSAVGIVQGSGHDNTYTHNDIYDGYHSGMEVCLPPSCPPGKTSSSGTFNNLASFNHLFDLFQGVTDDGGAIYFATGGPTYSPAGNQILNNKIHDTSDASIQDSDGYGGHGIYLDGSTGLVNVQSNLVYRVSGDGIKMTVGPQVANNANTLQNNILAYIRTGMIANANPYSSSSCPATLPLIFNAANNLFYFDRKASQSFYVQQGCEYTCGVAETAMHNWQSNLYWRLDAGFNSDSQAFHTQPNQGTNSLCGSNSYAWKYYSFSGWQGLGEDQGSVADENPGFNNPAYPNDDYSLPNGSPGAGFVVFDPTQAGRSNPVIKPSDPIDIPATFPTATYNPASDY
jgi:hypothetical protein